MIPWSATMSSALIRSCVLTTWLFASIGAITVSIDRSDIKAPPTRSSMIANGWRPLANVYEDTIGTNVSPSSHLERNLAPLHPVLGKFQEHMATSEKMKMHRKSKPSPSSSNSAQQDYSPPSILGSFTVFGHAAAKARGEAHPSKHIGSETREYTFLIPPPKDVYRFEIDSHRKAILRDNSPYIRQSQYIQNIHQAPEPVRSAAYYVKGYQSSTNSPLQTSPASNSKNRPSFISYTAPQFLQPPRHQPAKPFESMKVNNAKPYLQPPNTEIAVGFGKDKLNDNEHRQAYDRFPTQSHNAQILNPAGSGNFFSQINHPSHHYKTSFERDPAFLVHESHEVSYVTPPAIYNNFNFRPSIPYDTLLPPEAYASSPTVTPSTTASPPRIQESNRFKPNEVIVREDYKRPGTQAVHIKQHENSLQSEIVPTSGVTSTYYVSEHQDLTPPPSAWPAPQTKYTSDINEVLPRINPPAKFSQDVVNSNQIPQIPKILYVRPQQQQYQSSIVPHDIRPQTTAPQYETPESISLKHFNEQQFIIQQQLIQRDRQRLAEQERQQQLEIERQQQEELKKRQEELKELIQRQKEEEEQAEAEKLAAKLAEENSQKEAVKESEEQPPYTIQLAEYEIPRFTTETIIRVTEQNPYVDQGRIQELPQTVSENPPIQPLQIEVQEQNPNHQQQQEQLEYQDREEEGAKPYRPQKPSRDQYRRRKPTTTVYEIQPTEAPTQSPEISFPVETLLPQTEVAEEVPVQTTIPPETITVPTLVTTSVSQRPRIRRPGSPLRRRRPSTTTTEESVTVPDFTEQDFLKYDKAKDVQQPQLDNSRRRKVRPTQLNADGGVISERRPNIRKRPGHRNRVNPGEPFDAEIVTEIVQPPANVYKEPTESVQRYTEQVTNQPIQYYEYTSAKTQSADIQGEEITESPQIDFLTEINRNRDEHDDQRDDDKEQNANVVTNIPLEDLFVKTEGHYYDRATLPSSTSSSSSTTTTTTTTTTPAPISTTAKTHKMRPLRYGNATRPRFSIKDYKSRLDYKTRLTQVSTTEATVSSSPHTKQRLSNYKSQINAADNNRETTGRYKYMSRVNYRTTTLAPSGNDREQHVPDDMISSTTEKNERTNRFVPKRRPVSGNVYRSRISATTGSPNRSQQDNETPAKYSTARPENVFSSSIRRRPTMRSRLQQSPTSHKEAAPSERKEQFATEMTAEETSFYSAITTSASTTGNANEIAPVDKPVVTDHEVKLAPDGNEKQELAFQSTVSEDGTEKREDDLQKEDERKEDKEDATTKLPDEVLTKKPDVESTTRFDVATDEEELFAKASQSVADLTSSASALYDKPGMFKAVSPESRVVASHFKITTDEPTLPIEAFFQELSKKN